MGTHKLSFRQNNQFCLVTRFEVKPTLNADGLIMLGAGIYIAILVSYILTNVKSLIPLCLAVILSRT